jgi:hypothetical protein
MRVDEERELELVQGESGGEGSVLSEANSCE